MLVFVLRVLGRGFARCPEGMLRALCVVLGGLFWHGFASRRRLTLANLARVYPGKTDAERAAIGRECANRIIELGLQALVLPYLDEARLRRSLELDDSIATVAEALRGRPAAILVPHVTMMELLAFVPRVLPGTRLAALFRPLNQHDVSEFVIATRARWGLHPIRRKGGLLEAVRWVHHGGWLGIPADQHAGRAGTEAVFFGATTSWTPLPEKLRRESGATLVGLAVYRTAFFRGRIKAEVIPCGDAPGEATQAMADWFARFLLTTPDPADWLWPHRRWR